MCVVICKLSKEKTAAELKSSELQSQVNTLNGTIDELNSNINELQRKLNIISDTINSNTNNETSNDIQNLIIGKWKADRAFDSNGEEVSLNNVFGSGISTSNEMEFKQNGMLRYNISITASSDDGEYTVEGNTIKYGVPTDTKGVLTWHTATYNPDDDTLQEQNLYDLGYNVIYTRIK